ncbi:hypothetical protein ACPWT1_11760 [Ramlibacter sp. MMS24-I3-19]|uniref:hypothetical protein n=1 Tax=Ramlibacter sp. MMS24-I3-19 TaxID=3416606 RepID=UPI003D007B35
MAVPFQSAAGTYRTRVCASASSRRALVVEAVPRPDQVAPPSMLYCQVPWLLSTAVTAMPRVPVGSSIWPDTRSATSVPLPVVSSAMAAIGFAPSSTGALLVTVSLSVKLPRSEPPSAVPPLSCTVKATVDTPGVAPAPERNTMDSNCACVYAVPVATGVTPSASSNCTLPGIVVKVNDSACPASSVAVAGSGA